MSRGGSQRGGNVPSITPFPYFSSSQSGTLSEDDASSTHFSLKSGKSNAITHSHDVWIEIAPGKHVVHKIQAVDTNYELQEGRIPQEWYRRAQRTLSTLILVGTFMAGVEAQILCLIFTAQPTIEKTLAVCFGITALFLTSLSALYCAVTYIWLRAEWTPQVCKFDEWVSSSVSAMIAWTGTCIVVGVYCGFLAIIAFLFAITDHTTATICAGIFVVASICPLIWGLYRWQGLYSHALAWKPNLEGPTVISAHKADGSEYV
ncbi:hypothetical protein BC835DRAFT_1339316 [Cytidiella melzeri]|nr:hypothetical protein BC835DRAFT_1339316 [Cytidiella melzeri]